MGVDLVVAAVTFVAGRGSDREREGREEHQSQEVKRPFQEREKELTGGRDFYSVISGFQALSLASLVTEQLDTSTINANYLSAY